MQINIYLLKEYQGNKPTDIIIVDNEEIADDLVSQGIGRPALARDFLVKPEFYKRKSKSKAFKKSPRIK